MVCKILRGIQSRVHVAGGVERKEGDRWDMESDAEDAIYQIRLTLASWAIGLCSLLHGLA
jgi:hypothetical protein